MYRTDAHALQAILKVANDPQAGSTMQARWQTALGFKTRGMDFITGHGEVVRMLTETIDQIFALPENKQPNYSGSIMKWWTLVVMPDAAWNANNGNAVIGAEHIAILGSLGDVIESRLDQTSAAPGGLNLTTLREQCDEWLVLLDETELPTNLREMLKKGIEHLLWLIKNADRFGYARIARTAEDITGQLSVAATQVPDKQKLSWRNRMNQWGAGLLLFNGLVASTHLAIEQTADLIHTIEPGVAQVIGLVDGDDGDGDADGPSANDEGAS